MNFFTRFLFGLLASLMLVESIVRITAPIMGPPIKSWNTMQDAKAYKLNGTNLFERDGIFVLGNSTALMGIVPSVINLVSQGNLKVFNAAMNGSKLIHMKDFALDYIVPKQNPKALVLFLAPGTLDVPLEEEPGRNLLSSSILPSHTRDWLGERLYLFEYRNNLRDPMTLNAFRKSLFSGRTGFGIVNAWSDDLDDFGYTRLGYANNSIEGGWDLKDVEQGLERYSGNFIKSDIDSLNQLITVAKKTDTKIIISTVPLPYFAEQYRLKVKSLASLLSIPFISGNDAVTSGDYFSDGIHLNQRGAELFSKFVSQELIKLGL